PGAHARYLDPVWAIWSDRQVSSHVPAASRPPRATPRSSRAIACAALAVVLCAMAAGCGSAGNAERGPSAGAAAQLAAARAQIDRFRAMPAFVAPGRAFDAVSPLRSKTIFEIPITSEVPFIAGVEGGMRQAAARVGAHMVTYPNPGNPSEWA